MKMLFVLGAQDPEMDRIWEVLGKYGIAIDYATKDGKRVHPGNAYMADNAFLLPDTFVVFVECSVIGFMPDCRIDHHRPGDPGYGKGPEAYWEASSLGQMYALLGVPPEEGDRVLAAMDHCFNSAMKGMCPGVPAGIVEERKILEISKATKVDPTELRRMVLNWQGEIGARTARYEMSGECGYLRFQNDVVIDLTDEDLGIGYSAEYLTAQVAGVVAKQPIILRVIDTAGGQPRLHLCGDASPELVTHFMKHSEGDLERIYGAPDRGYAGGYKKN
ncbi:MAG: hypothetical protein HGA31_06645 [Candidatus Moranbacteria bacterium]|nr:hypothetical protein [Candidatus Moranbacteria bacterium]